MYRPSSVPVPVSGQSVSYSSQPSGVWQPDAVGLSGAVGQPCAVWQPSGVLQPTCLPNTDLHGNHVIYQQVEMNPNQQWMPVGRSLSNLKNVLSVSEEPSIPNSSFWNMLNPHPRPVTSSLNCFEYRRRKMRPFGKAIRIEDPVYTKIRTTKYVARQIIPSNFDVSDNNKVETYSCNTHTGMPLVQSASGLEAATIIYDMASPSSNIAIDSVDLPFDIMKFTSDLTSSCRTAIDAIESVDVEPVAYETVIMDLSTSLDDGLASVKETTDTGHLVINDKNCGSFVDDWLDVFRDIIRDSIPDESAVNETKPTQFETDLMSLIDARPMKTVQSQITKPDQVIKQHSLHSDNKPEKEHQFKKPLPPPTKTTPVTNSSRPANKNEYITVTFDLPDGPSCNRQLSQLQQQCYVQLQCFNRSAPCWSSYKQDAEKCNLAHGQKRQNDVSSIIMETTPTKRLKYDSPPTCSVIKKETIPSTSLKCDSQASAMKKETIPSTSLKCDSQASAMKQETIPSTSLKCDSPDGAIKMETIPSKSPTSAIKQVTIPSRVLKCDSAVTTSQRSQLLQQCEVQLCRLSGSGLCWSRDKLETEQWKIFEMDEKESLTTHL